MNVKKVGLIALVTLAVMVATTATAMAAATATIENGILGTNTSFLIGEKVNIDVTEKAPYQVNVSVYNSTGNLVWFKNTTVTGTAGYASTYTVTWDTSGFRPEIYTIDVWTNRSDWFFSQFVILEACRINHVKINGVPMPGPIKAYDKAKIEVNITTAKTPQSVTVIFKDYFGKVGLTGSVNTTTHYGVYTAVADLSRATYGPVDFYVNVSYGNGVYLNETRWIYVAPNATKKWIVVEADTPKPATWNIDSDDCAVLEFGKNVINATIFIAVADQYGNVNDSISKSYNATIYKVSGPTVSINKTTVTIDGSNPYQAVNVSVLASDAPCTVTVEIANGANTALETTTKSIYYTTGIDHLDVVVAKSTLYANNSDSTKVYVYLKDENGNTLKINGVSITLSEKTALGLQGLGTAATNASGVAEFTVTADAKSGVATIVAVTEDGSAYGTANITLLQAVNEANSIFAKPSITMTAGKAVKVVFKLRDYANEPIKDAKVKFNITSGDGWFEVNGKKVESPYVVTTDSNGNATIYVNSTNATSNQIKIEVYYINESGQWDKDDSICTITVNPAPVYRVAVFHGGEEITGYAFPEGYTTPIQFTVKYLDAFGNVNTSSGTVKIIPKSAVVGSFASDTVTLSGGSGSITFTPNASAKVGDSYTFVFNDTTFKVGNTTLTIAVSGIEAIKVTFDKPGYYINETVTVKAQLIGMYDTKLAKSGVIVTFTIKGPDYFKTATNSTNANGVAVTTFKPIKPGVYTVTAVNGSVYGVNETVVAGNQTKIVIEPKSVKVPVNTTVTFNISAYDINGYPSVHPYSKVNITVLKDGIVPINTSTVSLTAGKATWSFNFTEIGNYTVIAQLNESMFDTANVVVTPPAYPNITVVSVEVPEVVNVNETAEVEVTVHNYGNAAGDLTVKVIVIKPDNTSETFSLTFENVEPGVSAAKTVSVPVTMAGTYTVKVDTITKTFTAKQIVKPWQKYDEDGNGKINDTELLKAIMDWLSNKISDQDLLNVIMKWLE